jgi:hypothetical protein
MDAIEFNKTLSEAHSISSKLREKMLTECRNMGFEKHTTVKLLHCSLNSINEDEYTILQRSFGVGLKS